MTLAESLQSVGQVREVHPSPQDDVAQGVCAGKKRVLHVHRHRDHGHRMVLQVLHLVVLPPTQVVDVHLLVLRAGDQVALPRGRVRALQRQQRVRHAHAVPHGQVREDAGRRPVGHVDDRGVGVGGVHQQARRLAVPRRHVVDAGHASPRELDLELELEHAVLRALQHVDAAALRPRQQEHARVVELQGADLCLHLQLLQDHAIGHVHEAEHSIGVGSHEDLGVAGQELGSRHRP
mmetsp:Transcript_46607/g.134899  ORF Transcript_46607/g.134899 Transcript_46607/m.134899 type:complete len:235 (+) Transcript_46607:41-745(+)